MRLGLILAPASLLLVGAPVQEHVRPTPPPLEEVRFPPYETQVLDNGLRVYALEYDEQPVLSLKLVVRAGAANDPQALPGLASFTAGLLETGTTTRTATEIAEAIDNSGGQLAVTPGREAITISASVLGDTTGLAFELMRDVVLAPAFAPDEIERLRAQSLSALATSLQDPDYVADAVFESVLYGTHPYGHPAEGTPESLQAISRDDVIRFHQAWFLPNDSVLAIVGALPPEEAFDLAETWFGDWEPGSPPAIDLTPPDMPETNRIVIIDNPGSVQTEIRIGQTTVARNAADYFPVLVTSYVLGGPEGRLMESLRSEKSLTYGAYEAIDVRRGPGALYATTETRTETTLEAIDAIFAQIGGLREARVPEAELNEVKSYIIGQFPLTIEVPSDLAARLANLVVYDLGDDYLDTYRDRVARVDPEEVARISGSHLRDSGVVIVLLGQAEAFRQQVGALGTVEIIPLAQLDLGSPTLGKNP